MLATSTRAANKYDMNCQKVCCTFLWDHKCHGGLYWEVQGHIQLERCVIRFSHVNCFDSSFHLDDVMWSSVRHNWWLASLHSYVSQRCIHWGQQCLAVEEQAESGSWTVLNFSNTMTSKTQKNETEKWQKKNTQQNAKLTLPLTVHLLAHSQGFHYLQCLWHLVTNSVFVLFAMNGTWQWR